MARILNAMSISVKKVKSLFKKNCSREAKYEKVHSLVLIPKCAYKSSTQRFNYEVLIRT